MRKIMHNYRIFSERRKVTVDEAILQLIRDENLADQSAMRDRLRLAGHAVTQPTLSRHLKRLGIRKVRGAYRQIEATADLVPRYGLTIAQPNLVILKTKPGHAQVLAVLLDAENIPGAAGSIAGDDTVFIAARSPDDLDALGDRVRAILDRTHR
ncbi:MAG: arginine repressor [Gammaproteobacteria bacterium]